MGGLGKIGDGWCGYDEVMNEAFSIYHHLW